MKKLISIICAATLAVSLFGCGSLNKNLSNSTVYGKVSAISGSNITMQIGDLTQSNSGPDNSGAPSREMTSGAPSGDNSNGGPKDNDGKQGNNQLDSAQQGEKTMNGEGQPAFGESFTVGNDSMTFSVSNSATITLEDKNTSGSVNDIAVDDVLEVTFGDNATVTAVTVKNLNVGADGGSIGGDSKNVSNGTAAKTITDSSTVTDTTYTSTNDDENALRIDGALATLNGITVEKTSGSSSSTDNGDFYGQNAAILAENSAQVTISGATIDSSVKNGNGVFCYGNGTTVNISNSKITTTGNNSGGIQTTGGGTTNASNLNVSTSGNSSAAIRSDRGGGTVTVNGGTYQTAGTGSPAIYSTADITVKNSTLDATNSEAVVVEGLNSVALENCNVTGNMTGTYKNDGTENIHNIMLYQSMSGDAEVGTSSFTATGGTISGKTGDMFYVTNTSSKISLSGVKLNLANGTLLTVEGNSSSRGWGTAGKNGGKVEFTTADMTLEGNVTVDSISTLKLTLASGTDFYGSVNIVDNADGGTTVSDNAIVTVDKGALWTLTGNCKISSMTNNGTINFNGYTITLADGTVLNG